MSLKNVDGFDHLQGQSGASLLSSLVASGYTVTTGMAMAAGRQEDSHALELQVSAGAAGASWSSRTNTIKQDLHGVAADNTGRWVAVGDFGVAVSSTDNIVWTPVVLGVAANMKAIKCHIATWIAVGDNGTLLRSTDGRNFDKRNLPAGNFNLRDVAWGNGIWVAVGSSGSAGAILISNDDGLTWSQITIGAGALGNLCVAFGNVWMIGGFSGQLLTAPPTAIAWTAQAFGSVASQINAVAYAAGTWLAAAGKDIRRSVDSGVTWSVAALAVIPSGNINALTQSDGRWIAAGDTAALRMSDDGTVWTTPQFTGAGTANLYGLGISTGAQIGWCLVGAVQLFVTNPVATIYMSLAPPTKITRTFATAATKIAIGFAHRSTARGRILSITDLLDMDWPAGISILGQDGVAIPSRNVWYYYEIVIDKTAQTIDLYINNTLDLSVPLPVAGQTMTDFEITWIAENGAVTRLDDVYLLDSAAPAGEALVARLGPISIPIRMPTADVRADWIGSAIGPHWPLIGLLPPSASTYIRSAVSGAIDLFTSDTELPDGAGSASAPIIAVGLVALAQKGDIDNRQLGLVVGAPGAQKQVIDTSLSTTPEYSYAIFEKAPDDSAWDAANILTTPFGVVVRP